MICCEHNTSFLFYFSFAFFFYIPYNILFIIIDDGGKSVGWMLWVSTAKDPPIVKSIFSLGLNFSEWMNSRTYIGLVRIGPFYREFEVDLLVRCH